MSSAINFELVSPEAKLVSEPVYMAEIPGDDGAFGVMAGHASLVSSLRAGVVRLHKAEGDTEVREIFIAGGFADVTPDNCTVLAEDVTLVADLDRNSLEQHLSDLYEDLGMAVEAVDKARVNAKISLTKAKLAAIT